MRKWRLQPGKMLLIDLEEGRIVEDEEIKAKLADAEPYEEWLNAGPVQAGRAARCCPKKCRPSRTIPRICSISQQAFGYTAGGHQILPGADGGRGRGSGRLDGHRYAAGRALQQAQAALQLFQAEFRPGDQSADRSDPRGTGDEPGVDDRAAAQSAGPRRGRAQAAGSDPAGADQRRCGKDPRHLRTGGRRLPHRHHRLHLAGGRGRGRAFERHHPHLLQRHRCGAGRQQYPDPVGPGGFGRPHSGAVGAGHRGGASSPDPPGASDADRPGGGDRRSPRSASFLRAGGLWRRSHQSLSRLRDAGADPGARQPDAQAL